MVDKPDPRLTPARADLAAEHLRGTVNAARYVGAQEMQVCVSLAPLYGVPDANSKLQTEVLLGECFDVYEQKNGWAWGQAKRDGYVGYVPDDALVAATAKADHRIAALRTPIFSAPDLKAPVQGYAHENSIFTCEAKQDGYLQIASKGAWVFANHTAPVDAVVSDWVFCAKRYEHTPYVWGGRSSFGVDCSGLVQNALAAGGIAAPRDTDMQHNALGKSVDVQPGLSGLRRGDLVFWEDHVGIMLDPQLFMHANAYHMRVACEPLGEAVKRIQKTAGAITAIRRLL